MKGIKSKIFAEYIRDTFRTRKHILKVRNKAVRNIIKYAFNNSKYYHDSFSKAGVTSANIETFPIDKLPSINKKILLDNYDDILTDKNLSLDKIINHQDLIDKQYHLVRSSGSSEKIGYFIYDQEAWDKLIIGTVREFIKTVGIFKTAEAMFKKTKFLYIAITNGQHGGSLLFSSCINQFNLEFKLLNINAPFKELISEVKKYKPDYIVGYPTAICLLTDEILNSRDVKMKIKGIVSCGEALSKAKRQYLEKAYHCKILNLYDASESLLIGSEYSSGFHLFDNYNYIEIIDNQLYITNLYNYVQPLIRYKMSDFLKPTSNEKTKYIKYQIGTGREEDILWFTNKNGEKEYLHPLMFEDFCYNGLLDYQLIQDRKDHFTLLFTTSKTANTHAITNFLDNEIKTILEEHELSFISYDVKQVNAILPDKKTGKKRLTVGLK